MNARCRCSRRVVCGVFASVFAAGSLAAEESSAKIDFAHDIVPIIKTRCAECHTNGTYKGSLSLDTRADVLNSKKVVLGKSAESELIDRVTSDENDFRMPPKGERLTAKQVAMLRAWIDRGLAWEEGFSFKGRTYLSPLKFRDVKLPPRQPGAEHPIDRILAVYYAGKKMAPPTVAADNVFIRRVYLDLIGQLPTPTETQSFCNDSSNQKRASLVARLLAEKRPYAEHWLTFWNDLLRNDYQGTGYIDGGRKQITNWLYRSLLEDKPFDQFARELISPTAESEGFINGIKWRGRVNASQVREIQFSQNVSQVFFGINMKCASCHDSFIDTWKLTDAYGLAAVIAEAPLEIHRCDKATGEFAKPAFPWPELGAIEANLPREKRLERLAELVTDKENGRFARTICNRLWQRLFGRGLVHPVDIMANPPWNEDLLDYLANYLKVHRYSLAALLEHMATSQAYQSVAAAAGENAGDEYVFHGPEIKRMSAEQFIDAIWSMTTTAPAKLAAPLKPPPFSNETPAERQYVRAALVNADPLMRSLGRPNREQVVTIRGDVLTTLQALDLANGEILSATLARGAENLLTAEGSRAPAQMVETLCWRAFSRPPTAGELDECVHILGDKRSLDALADLLWTIVMQPEFQLIR